MGYIKEEVRPIDTRIYNIESHLMHSHQKFLEILFVLKGKIDVKMSFEDFLMGEGDFLVVNFGDYHSIKEREENAVVSFYFDLDYYKRYFKHIENTIFICDSMSDSDFDSSYENNKNIIRKLLAKIVIESGIKNSSYSETMDNLVIKLITMLVNNFSRVNFYNRSCNVSNYKLDKYYLIMQYINEKYSEQRLLEDISNNEYLCKSYLSHIFKDVSAWSFQDMLSFTRIWKSEELLLNSDMSVNEISYKIGFSDPKYYYKNFKKYYHCTPLDYRKRLKKDIEAGNRLHEVELRTVIEIVERYSKLPIPDEEIEYDIETFSCNHLIDEADCLMGSDENLMISIRYKDRSIEEWKLILEHCIETNGLDKIANCKFGILFTDMDLLDDVNALIEEIDSLMKVKIKPIYGLR